jgi:hypothetical protein
VLLPRQQAKLARGTKDKERAMSQTSNTAIAVIGIDIGKNMAQRPRHIRSCTDNGLSFYCARLVISSRP